MTTEEEEDQDLIYLLYGMTMHEVQVFELAAWGFKAVNLKKGISLDQGMAKVEKWDGTTLGDHVRAIKSDPKWPSDLKARLEESVARRNHLAHHFLREYFVVTPSDANVRRASAELTDAIEFFEALNDDIDAYLKWIGVPSIDNLSQEELEEIDKLRPLVYGE